MSDSPVAPWWNAHSDIAPLADDVPTWPLADQTKPGRRRRLVRRATTLLVLGAILTLATGAQFGFAHRISDIGPQQAQANCSPTSIFNLAETGPVVGIGPFSDDPKTQRIVKVAYKQSPPVGGAYYAGRIPDQARPFRGQKAPSTEILVTGINSGATVVWYRASKITPSELADLKAIAARSTGYLVIAAWDERRGPWTTVDGPAGAGHADDVIAMSAWQHSQTCERVSGQVIQAFMLRFPITNAPAAPK